MIPIVTAIDEKYLPGLKALYNSYKANAGKGFKFHCIVYGSDKLRAEVRALGVNVIIPPKWRAIYPTTKEWPESLPSMYARLLVPKLFKKKAIWIDADCIVVKPLNELAKIEFSEVVAGVGFNGDRYTLGFHINNLDPKLRSVRVPFAGLLIFNCEKWNKEKITEQCSDLMDNHGEMDFRYVVQSVLGYVLHGKFHWLDYKWQIFANRATSIPENAMILHYVGAVPWLTKMEHQDAWDLYK